MIFDVRKNGVYNSDKSINYKKTVRRFQEFLGELVINKDVNNVFIGKILDEVFDTYRGKSLNVSHVTDMIMRKLGLEAEVFSKQKSLVRDYILSRKDYTVFKTEFGNVRVYRTSDYHTGKP